MHNSLLCRTFTEQILYFGTDLCLWCEHLLYSSRLFKSDPVVSLLQATRWQYFIAALSLPLSLPLHWLRITFVLNTLIALKELFFRPVSQWHIQKTYIALTSLWFYRDIARTEDFRKPYLYLLKVLDKICCLRPTRIRLHNSKWFEQNGLLLEGILVNRNWFFWVT